MPLLAATRDFLARVEDETGFPVRLTEDASLPTLARIRPARGNAPAHFVQYKPTRDESLDYVICLQCGFVLRLFAQPPTQRCEFGGTAAGERAVLRLVSDPQSQLAQLGLESAQLGQMAANFYGGLLTHLRSVPIGLRIADWIFDRYPGLRASQRATVLKELAEAKAALQPNLRALTPERILQPTMAINAAQALFWAERYDMRELAGESFRSALPGLPRVDAVMYCLGALEKFADMTPDEVQKVGFEIGILGMSGLDTNDSTPKYRLRSLPGEFSGLHLVALMYVAFQQIAPGQDVGFDLAREYEMALTLYEGRAAKDSE